ncbi:MAG: transglycosylase SLT domain-containing protein [Muribaculaceae bacterium]|nr:transglycosylase SLT domain-containing protein [Muribaculaceae bacterium]
MKTSHILTIALAAALCVPAVNMKASAQQSTVLAPVRTPQIPQKVSFADTEYDTDRIDIYERLDRELTGISYTHGNTLLLLKRANRYFPEIIPILKKNGVPEDLIYLACIESTLNPRAYSPAKAAGIWQFIPSTAKQYGLEVNEYVDERYDVEKATAAACRFLKSLKSKYGDWESVAAAYNGGPARISKELDSQLASTAMDLYLTEETSRYMFRILATKLIMENPRAYGFSLNPDQFYTPMEYDIVEVSTPVEDWPSWAKKHGITYAQLKDANMWIRDKTLPNKTGKTYRVRVPKKSSLHRSTASKAIYNQAWVK